MNSSISDNSKIFKENKKSLKLLSKDFNSKFSASKKQVNSKNSDSSELYAMLNELTGLFEEITRLSNKTIKVKNNLYSTAGILSSLKESIEDSYRGSLVDRALLHLSTIWNNSIEYLTISDVLKYTVSLRKELKKLEQYVYNDISHGSNVDNQRDICRSILENIILNFNNLSKRLNYETIQERKQLKPLTNKQLLGKITFHTLEIQSMNTIPDKLLEGAEELEKQYINLYTELTKKKNQTNEEVLDELITKLDIVHKDIRNILQFNSGFKFKTIKDLSNMVDESIVQVLPGQKRKQEKQLDLFPTEKEMNEKVEKIKSTDKEELQKEVEKSFENIDELFADDLDYSENKKDSNDALDIGLRMKRMKERYNIFSKYRSIRAVSTEEIKELIKTLNELIVLLSGPVKQIKDNAKSTDIDLELIDKKLEEVKFNYSRLDSTVNSYMDMYRKWFLEKGSEEQKKEFYNKERSKVRLDSLMRRSLI